MAVALVDRMESGGAFKTEASDPKLIKDDAILTTGTRSTIQKMPSRPIGKSRKF